MNLPEGMPLALVLNLELKSEHPPEPQTQCVKITIILRPEILAIVRIDCKTQRILILQTDTCGQKLRLILECVCVHVRAIEGSIAHRRKGEYVFGDQEITVKREGIIILIVRIDALLEINVEIVLCEKGQFFARGKTI